MTPIAGLGSDKFTTRWGKRMPWYVAGSFIVFPTFAGIFVPPEYINETIVNAAGEKVFKHPELNEYWYITLPALFNVGWAFVQIAHMAVVNSLSGNPRTRDTMVNNRNGFTYFCNITILLAALLAFAYVDDRHAQFRYMCYLCLTIGTLASLFFITTIDEPGLTATAVRLEKQYQDQVSGAGQDTEGNADGPKEPKESKDWKGWLSVGTFYVHGMIYMLVRVAVNVTMTIQPFYLQRSLGYHGTKENPTPVPLAAIPLWSYVCSLIFSMKFQSKMTKALGGRLKPMLVAVFVIAATSIPLIYLPADEPYRKLAYPLVAIQGIGLAIMLNTGTSLISDVIGADSENSAFVYGMYSLFDKFANGGFLFYVLDAYASDPTALRYVLGLTPVVCAVLSYIFTWIGQACYGHQMLQVSSAEKAEEDGGDFKNMIN